MHLIHLGLDLEAAISHWPVLRVSAALSVSAGSFDVERAGTSLVSPFAGLFIMNPLNGSSGAGGSGDGGRGQAGEGGRGGAMEAMSTGAAGLGIPSLVTLGSSALGRHPSISSPPTAAMTVLRGGGGGAQPSGDITAYRSGSTQQGDAKSSSSASLAPPMVGKLAGMEPLPDVDMELDWER